jgi:hypothetical protein
MTAGQQSLRRREPLAGTELVRRFAEDCCESADEIKRGQIRLARRDADGDVRRADIRKQVASAAETQEGVDLP